MELNPRSPLDSVKSRARIAMMFLVTLVLAACSGSDGSGDGETPWAPTTASPFVVMGTITGYDGLGFGLSDDPSAFMYVNEDAAVTVNGLPATLDDLQDGEFTLIRGTRWYTNGEISSWRLDSIDVRQLVIGPLESIDVDHARLVVMGQQVSVTGDTLVADVPVSMGDLETLQAGDTIVVSGLLTASGELVATRVASQASDIGFLLRGLVAASDPATSRLRVGGLDVHYGQAEMDFQDFPGGGPAVGDQIVIRADDPPSGNLLEAVSVAFVPGTLEAAEYAGVELSGAVTRYVSAADFDVAGVKVSLLCTSHCGDDPQLLRADVPVEVIGVLDANGIVRAEAFAFLTSGDITLTAPIAAIDPVSATLTVHGFEVQPNVLTWFGSERISDASVTSAADLQVGDVVAASGTFGGNPGLLLASKVLRVPNQGPQIASADFNLANPAIIVLGRQLQTNGSTNFDVCGRSADAARLFSEPYAELNYYFVRIGLPVTVVDPLEALWVSVNLDNYC